jgi:hypothetical protein
LRRARLDRGALPYTLATYYVAGLPAASLWTGAHVFVLDDVGGAVEAFSDGVNWRRVTDRTILSAVLATSLDADAATSGSLSVVVGPYMISTGAATGTMSAASIVAAGLSAVAAAVATLGTPPKVSGDLTSTGTASGILGAMVRQSAGLQSAGSATGVMEGVAA